MKKMGNINKEVPRKILRKKSLSCMNNLKKRSVQQKRTYPRRPRSCEPNMKLKKNTSLPKFRRKTRPCSASSLKSVIYIGKYKKIPKLIFLDDCSDQEETNVYKRKLRKNRISNSSSFKRSKEKNSNNRIRNALRNENDILSMLNEMHINTDVANTVFA